ncbi:MAG: hypothetical protein K2X81_26740 [Candidatus Obscuribacterales bacterium]|nr:hypothetical protein [Candidatus Obscuribacterales bacterium]
MAPIVNWIKKIFEAFMPSPESSAWDELKRARAMETIRRHEQETLAPRYRS